MLRAPGQTMYEDEFSDRPANRINRLFVETAAIVQQRDVGCEIRTHTKPRLSHCHPQRLMKHHHSIDAVSSTQNERVAVRQAFYAIECNVKRRRCYSRACFHSLVNNASRQAIINADAMDRDMKSCC